MKENPFIVHSIQGYKGGLMKNYLFFCVLLLACSILAINQYQSIWADKTPLELELILYQVQNQPPHLI